nr:hypothetical protein KPHV_46450 [Kitasatospora purpeofusca]
MSGQPGGPTPPVEIARINRRIRRAGRPSPENGSGRATTPAGGESGGRLSTARLGGEEPDRVSTVANDP